MLNSWSRSFKEVCEPGATHLGFDYLIFLPQISLEVFKNHPKKPFLLLLYFKFLSICYSSKSLILILTQKNWLCKKENRQNLVKCGNQLVSSESTRYSYATLWYSRTITTARMAIMLLVSTKCFVCVSAYAMRSWYQVQSFQLEEEHTEKTQKRDCPTCSLKP